MSKTTKNGIEIEKSVGAPNDSTWQKPNPKGDWCNIFLLTLLYIIQGVPFGLTSILPIIIQSNYSVTYNDQGSFSFVLWPYSIRILWAPIVDSFYIRWIGQRKSWFIPVQYLIGALLLCFAYNMDEWLPESGKPNLTMIVCLFLVINFLNTTQDIVVDSWALTMLKKNNTSYAGSCNFAGLNAGVFIGSVFPILLSSEKFCNKYLRFTPDSGGIFNIRDIIFFWSIIMISITTLVAIFKKEKDINLEDVKITIFQSYKLIWNIIKRPGMGIFLIALLTSSIGYATMEAVSYLKLVDAGVSKDSIMIINTAMIVLKIILPIPASKYTGGPKPLKLIFKFTLIRLLWNIPYALLIYYTPLLITNNGVVNVSVYYYLISGFIIGINDLLNGIMIISYTAFFIKITDSRFAGTYLTLLNSFRILGWITPNTVILKMFDILTFKKCSNDGHDCSTTDFQNICNTKQSHNCVTIVDGYYIEVAICIVIGFVWYSICKRIYKNVELKDPSHWIVDMNKHISVNI